MLTVMSFLRRASLNCQKVGVEGILVCASFVPSFKSAPSAHVCNFGGALKPFPDGARHLSKRPGRCLAPFEKGQRSASYRIRGTGRLKMGRRGGILGWERPNGGKKRR